MDVRSMLLGFLMHGDMTGYDLKKFFSISFSFFSGLSYGSIYPALKKMEREGLISMRVEVRDGAPNRKVYSVTETGKEAFIEALRSPYPPGKSMSAFLTRLFFFAYLTPDERRESAAHYLASITQIEEELRGLEPHITRDADHFQYLCYQFGRRLYRDMIRNVSEVVDDLESEDGDVEKRNNA